jgi:outer membrane protein
MKNLISCVFLVLLTNISTLQAQEVWGLEKCINYAIQKSLQVEGSLISLKNTEIDATTARHGRYPNLSANTNVGWNFGRTIDPTRNEFITETFFNNGFGLNSNVVLFNGNRINNTISQSQINNQAALKELEQVRRDIALNVATLYLNILFAKENLQNAQNQLVQTNDQLSLLNKQISVGNRPENDRLDLEAQIAANEQSIIESQNNLTINLLNLKQLLRLDPDFNLDVTAPSNLEFDTDPELLTFAEVYASALSNQAGIAASELRLKSAALGVKMAQSELMPTIGAGVSARTNYSNKGVTVNGFNEETFNQDIIFNGQTATIGFIQQVPILDKTPYFDQVTDNLSYGVGISMNIPIYNNNLARAGVQKAKLNTQQADLNYVQLKESLKITVGQALADAKAAKSRYQASTKTLQAQTNLYNNAVKRFDIGNLNAFELTRLKTQMETSTVNQLIAKYDYLFRTEVLDFYLGRAIKF